MKLFLFVFLFVTIGNAASINSTGVLSNVVAKSNPSTITWSNIASSDTTVGVETGYAKSVSVQLSGTFTATTVHFEGSNDGSTYYQLDDIEGNAISKTAAAFFEVRDRPKYMRPKISAGGASTDVTAVMYMTK